MLDLSSAHYGTLVWLGVGALLLLLVLLAFGYLLVRRYEAKAGTWVARHVPSGAVRWVRHRAPALARFVEQRFASRPWYGLALTTATVVGFGSVYAFALVAESWTEQETLYRVDEEVHTWLQEASSPAVDRFMEAVTTLGDPPVVTVLAVLLGIGLLVRRRYWQALGLTVAVGGGALLMLGMKALFARTRPAGGLLEASGHSFPSGHTLTATTLYGFGIYLVWRTVQAEALRLTLGGVLLLALLLVGVSRVLLGVHWVSDVAGGWALGLAWLVCSLVLVRAVQSHRGTAASSGLIPPAS